MAAKKHTMSPEAFRDARRALGLTQAGMAAILGVTARAVRHYELGARKVSGPVAKLVDLLLEMRRLKLPPRT